MSKEKKKQIKNILILNLVIGIYNIISFSIYGSWSALVIVSLNIGAWVFLRDLKLIPVIIKKFNN